MKKIILFILSALLAFPVVAQSYHPNWSVRAFRNQDGLPYEVVRDISWHRDSPVVWFATWSGGVACFDGLNWRTLAPSTGFPFDSIRTVTAVGAGKAWIGADLGLVYVDLDRKVVLTKEKYPTLVESNCFSSLRVSEEEVWIGTFSGYILAVSAEIPAGASPTWRVVLGDELTRGAQIRKMIRDRQGRIWVANSDTGVLCFEGSSWRKVATSDELGGDCLSICEAPDGSIWATGLNALNRYDGKGWEVVHTFHPAITCVVFTPDGIPLVGTNKGLFVRQNEKWNKFSLDQESPDQYVETLACQPDGIVWVGTRVGAFRLSPTLWTQCTDNDNNSKLLEKSLIAEPDRPPLALSENNELMQFDGTLWRPILALPSRETSIGMMTRPREEKVWILSGTDVFHCSLTPPALLEKISVPGQFDPRSLYQDKKGDLWLLSSTGLYRLDKGSWIAEPAGKDNYIREKIQGMAHLENGDYWIGYDDRVEHWHGREITSYPARGKIFQGWPPTGVILETHDKRLIFGTPSYGLLFRDTKNNWTKITEKEGLFRNRVSSLYEDTRNILWVGHRDNGLSFQYGNLWIPHKYHEGLPNGSVLCLGEYPAGKMWASVTGSSFYTYSRSEGSPDTTLFVADAELSENESAFISFKGIDLWKRTRSENLYFSYRIIPESQRFTDLAWSPFTRETQVMLPLLESGQYLIQVRSLDSDGNLDPSPATTTLTVNPPVWQRGEFYFPVIILSLVTLIALAAFFRKHIALTESEERYRTLVEDALTVILKWDSAERITYWNEYAEKLFCIPADQAVGSTVQETLFSQPEDGHKALSEIRQMLISSKGLPVQRRSQHTSKDGRHLHLNWIYRSVLDDQGQMKEVHAFGTDCTEQVVTENALLESEQTYKSLVEGASDSIVILQDGIVKYANPQLSAMTGYPLESLLNHPFLNHVDEKDREKVLQTYSRRLSGETVQKNYEVKIRDRLGRRIETETHASLISYEGRPASLVLLRDITQRKQAQEALLKSSRMEVTATLAGGIAHDFNNLMVGILGYAELLRMEFQNQPDIIRMLDRVIQSAERAGELSQQMLSYARGGRYHPQEIDLNFVVMETIRQRAKSFPDGIRLESKLSPDLPFLIADPVQISEVIIGLLSNAVEALSEGGRITIETSRGEENGSPSENLPPDLGQHLVLTVADNGCGMDHEILSRIFEPFFTTKFQGRGLGLAAVYGIVKNHGGEISVDSEKGQGTSFKVYLPLGNS